VTLRTRFCNAGENTSRLLSTTYLALTPPRLTQSRSMQQQTVDEPSLDEVTCAIRKLRNGRAAGPGGIPPELLKCAINPISKALHEIFIQVWRTGHVPSDWKDGIQSTAIQSTAAQQRPDGVHVVCNGPSPALSTHRWSFNRIIYCDAIFGGS